MRETQRGLVAAFHWAPGQAWDIEAIEALDYLDAHMVHEAHRVSLQSLALFNPERLAEMVAQWSGIKPATNEEAYGAETAKELADLEARQRKWLQEHEQGS